MSLGNLLTALAGLIEREQNGVGSQVEPEITSYMDALILLDGMVKFCEKSSTKVDMDASKAFSSLSKAMRHGMSQADGIGKAHGVFMGKVRAEMSKAILRRYNSSVVKTFERSAMPEAVREIASSYKKASKVTVLYTSKCDGLFLYGESDEQCVFEFVSAYSETYKSLVQWVSEQFQAEVGDEDKLVPVNALAVDAYASNSVPVVEPVAPEVSDADIDTGIFCSPDLEFDPDTLTF